MDNNFIGSFRKEVEKMHPVNVFLQGLKEIWETHKRTYSQDEIHKQYFSKAIVNLDCFAQMSVDTINKLHVARGRMVADNEDKLFISTFYFPQ